MAITLPLPLRVAAGILGTGIDLVRSLPDDIPALPVTLVGNAMKLSIKVQQEIATLATRGDELLGGVVGGPVENPAWAKFDDDEPVTPVTKLKAAPPVAVPKPSKDEDQHEGSALTTPAETSMPPGSTTAMEAALEVDPALLDEALVAVDNDPEATIDGEPLVVPDEIVVVVDEISVVVDEVPVPGDEDPVDELTADELDEALAVQALRAKETSDPENFDDNPVVFEETAELTEGLPLPESLLEDVQDSADQLAGEPSDGPGDGPAALPGYDAMTLAQVRGHLRDLTPDDVSALLRWEQDGDSRPPFLTLLSNRLVTLDAKNQ